jgi:tRNA 2-thiouridine synthesizing protein A
MADATLDARGLTCPMPVLKARKALQGIKPGGTLAVLATDPGATRDFVALCDAVGHELVESKEENGVFSFLIRRAA